MTTKPRSLHELLAVVKEFEASREKWSEKRIADTLLPSISADEMSLIARELIQQWAWDLRRKRQLAVERASQREAESAKFEEEAAKAELERNSQKATEEERFKAVYENPEKAYGGVDQEDSGVYTIFHNAKTRRSFRAWCGDKFEDWYLRAESIARETSESGKPALSRNMHDFFLSDWYIDGPQAYFRQQQVNFMLRAINDTAQRVRLEVTEELLGEQFALGDGRRVTWGMATVADHEQRIELLAKNAAANVEAAARHQAAIDMIKEAGAEHLGDLTA